MKSVKYMAEYDGNLPSLGISVKPGDVIEVEDDFDNALFVLVDDAEALDELVAPEAPVDPEA